MRQVPQCNHGSLCFQASMLWITLSPLPLRLKVFPKLSFFPPYLLLSSLLYLYPLYTSINLENNISLFNCLRILVDFVKIQMQGIKTLWKCSFSFCRMKILYLGRYFQYEMRSPAEKHTITRKESSVLFYLEFFFFLFKVVKMVGSGGHLQLQITWCLVKSVVSADVESYWISESKKEQYNKIREFG